MRQKLNASDAEARVISSITMTQSMYVAAVLPNSADIQQTTVVSFQQLSPSDKMPINWQTSQCHLSPCKPCVNAFDITDKYNRKYNCNSFIRCVFRPIGGAEQNVYFTSLNNFGLT